MMKSFLICLFVFLPTAVFADPTVTFTSPSQQATLIELYTSEGCSSCPPADEWFSSLKNHPRLWKDIIPIAFHVDYWDYLGWKDKFSRAQYSQRQRNYARLHHLKTVYTPGFLQNGKESRVWFNHRKLTPTPGKSVGQLSMTITDGIATATFKPVKTINGPLVLNIAWLGFDLRSAVQAGENRDKVLQHDFVCLELTTQQGFAEDDTYRWQFTSDKQTNKLPEIKGIAFWVTQGADPLPLQAAGGWLSLY